jgi:hypothetical protein
MLFGGSKIAGSARIVRADGGYARHHDFTDGEGYRHHPEE